MVKTPISEADHVRIAEAVAAAERASCAEIRCVLALETGRPALTAIAAGALCALLAPPLALFAGLDPERLFAAVRGWTAVQDLAPRVRLWMDLSAYVALQALVFAVVAGGWQVAPLRRFLTPRALVAKRVRAAAEAQFEALGLTHTQGRTGVLVYASLADHRAEVLADSGVWEKVRADEWQTVVDALVMEIARGEPAQGFVAAVETAGALLAARLPPRPDAGNELPDRLTVESGRN